MHQYLALLDISCGFSPQGDMGGRERHFFNVPIHLFPCDIPGEGSFQMHAKEVASSEMLTGGSTGHAASLGKY